MGSKTLPATKRFPDKPPEDSASGSLSEAVGSKDGLLRRIADALQVPQAVLYQPPNAVTPARSTDGDGPTDLDRDCAALLHAFRRVADPEERRRILALVQAAAEQT